MVAGWWPPYVWHMRVLVEVCVTTLEEALAATGAEVDSIECCTWLGAGGVSPSPGAVRAMLESANCRVRVLARPFPGAFAYEHAGGRAVLADIKAFVGMEGVFGLVSGALSPDGLPDESFLTEARAACGAKELTFHRAIDHAPALREALERCIEHRCDRVLTSGGAETALEGLRTIRSLVEQAAGRIRIAAGAGVDPANVVRLVEGTGVGEVHFSAQSWTPRQGALKGAMLARPQPDIRKIEGVLNALSKAGLR